MHRPRRSHLDNTGTAGQLSYRAVRTRNLQRVRIGETLAEVPRYCAHVVVTLRQRAFVHLALGLEVRSAALEGLLKNAVAVRRQRFLLGSGRETCFRARRGHDHHHQRHHHRRLHRLHHRLHRRYRSRQPAPSFLNFFFFFLFFFFSLFLDFREKIFFPLLIYI